MADYTPGDSNLNPQSGPKSGLANGNFGRGGGNGGANGGAGGSGGMVAPGHLGSSGRSEHEPEGLMHILGRQWHVVVLCTIASIMLSVLYLMLAKPVYTSVSTLRVKPLDPQSIASTATDAALADSDFLDTECVVIKSNAVLALAMDKIKDTRTLKGMSHPLDYVKGRIDADLAKKGQAIEVSFESHYPEDANQIVDAVVDAYKEYEAQSWKSRANDVLDTLRNGSKGAEQDLLDKQMKLHEIEQKTGFVPDIDPSKNPQHQHVLNLREAQEKAQLEVMQAHNAYEQAAKATIGDPAKLDAVRDAEQRAAPSSDPQSLLKRYQDELGIEEAKLGDDSRNYGPSHPVIMTDQARVDQMIVLTVVAAKAWQDSAKAQLDSINQSLADAQAAELASSEMQRQYMQLQLEIEELKKGTEEVDNKISQINLVQGAGALNISVLNPAEITGDPKPTKPRTLGAGLLIGLIGGLGLACLRDWTDDRMRSAQAIRSAAGAPVLGAVPVITTAYTAADRGQIVHHDPFGDAAESYRTLRTALQFGLPAGTKTLLITSPMSGDGKSTFVSNLGIAMAQASRRVLIIDADLRAPMQHRLFGLKDRIGLSTVLGGGDTMAQAIQRTEIEGLDLLPCGPMPTNPAEMLNSPAFIEHLNDLADKYDLVLLDSPPVTAVADARILAASVDASLLVIRLEASTRKQTESARDGLRSVGGRLIGVAINSVSRSAHFGGSTGYYAHGDFMQPASRAPRQASYVNPDAGIDPAART
jgi:capsular exopolysaccharide synthesis family protein